MTHHLDSGRKIANRTIMEVGSSLRDVTEGRHLEHHLVDLSMGHVESTLILLIGPRIDHTRLHEHRPTEERTVVTAHATGIHKLIESTLLVISKGVPVTQEILVPTAGFRESPLESSDCDAHVPEADRVLEGWKRRGEPRDELGTCLQASDNAGSILGGHLLRVEDGTESLLLNGVCASVPELGDVAGSSEDRGSVAPTESAGVAGRELGGSGTVGSKVMAGVAGDITAIAKDGIAVELLAKSDQRRARGGTIEEVKRKLLESCKLRRVNGHSIRDLWINDLLDRLIVAACDEKREDRDHFFVLVVD